MKVKRVTLIYKEFKYTGGNKMKYNFDEVIDRTNEAGSFSTKWSGEGPFMAKMFMSDTVPEDRLCFFVADMDFRCAEPIVKAVVERASHGLFGYALRDQAHKDCVLNWQTKRYGTTPKAEWMAYAPPGVLFAVNLIVEILTEIIRNAAITRYDT